VSGAILLLLFGAYEPEQDATRPLSDLGWSMLNSIPTAYRGAPEFQAVFHAASREIELAEARLGVLREQLIPQRATEFGLPWWEGELRIPAIEGQSLAARRASLTARLRRSLDEGRDWVGAVADLVGAGWSYQEYAAGDPDGPPPDTIWIKLPYRPGAPQFVAASLAIREITAATIDLVISSNDGFILDESQLDQEQFNA
jgi:hypothetical protein